MKTQHAYFTYLRNPKTNFYERVALEIDCDALSRKLFFNACRSKYRRSTASNGAIKLRIIEAQKEDA